MDSRPQAKLHQGSLRQASRRKDWNYGPREAKIITTTTRKRWCQVSHEGGNTSLGVGAGGKVRNQDDQQQDGGRYEKGARGAVHNHGHEL